MKSIMLGCVAAWLWWMPVLVNAIEPGKSKPNVIFILTDDQGWNDAHFAGHPYVKTPNLDKFAGQSTWLRQFYVASTVCSPSRCGFMTAHYPARHLIHGHFATHEQNAARHMPDWLDPKTTTLTGLLKSAGYATAHFGKWHLGHGTGAPPPQAYGIDVSKVVNGNGEQLGDEAREPYFRAKSTELIIDETIQFIRANKDKPFYVNAWTLVPHALLKPTPEQLAVYDGLTPHADNPAFGAWLKKYYADAKDLDSQMKVFCASLTDLDTQLGRLFDALDEMQLADNTLVFLSSDNGPEDYRVSNAANAGVGSTGPLRARKRSMYEGGVRTFGLVRWPGHVPAGVRDETSVTSGVDLLPTVCKLAGVELPQELELDGEDVSDIWLGQSRPRKRPLHWEWLTNVAGGKDGGYMPPMLSIRDGDWKLFVNHDGSDAQLYNIPQDIGEERDVAAQHRELVKSLSDRAIAWSKSLPASPARNAARQTIGVQSGKSPGTPATSQPSPKNAKVDRAAIFARRDANQDGRLSFEEFKAGLAKKDGAEQRFKSFDTDSDNQLSSDEFVRAGQQGEKAAVHARNTVVSIVSDRFFINGQPTYKDRKWKEQTVEGLLMNSRMVQAIFDDRNPETVSRWAYPDTKKWDADRNTAEFIEMMPIWRQHGLLAMTLNLQGGSPEGYSKDQPWYNSAINSDGTLDPRYMARLERVIDKADELGMVVILGLYYFGQDQRVHDEAAVTAGVDAATDWLISKRYTNVLVEVNNECNVKAYDHDILKPDRVHELIERVRERSLRQNHRLLVGTSYGGNAIPRPNVVKASDFLLLHGNGVSDPKRIGEMVRLTRQIEGYRPMPVLFNEDDHFNFDQPENNFVSALQEYSSWGFFDYRQKGEGFDEGYQSVPVNWKTSSSRKQGFYKLLSEITGHDAK